MATYAPEVSTAATSETRPTHSSSLRLRETHRSRVSLTALTAVIVGLSVTLLAVTLYMLTLAPSVMPGDYAEFQLCAAVLGIPHPTGYPLYILLGKLFTLLPIGDVAYRVNLSSAVYMAGAVGALYAISWKLIRLLRMPRMWWAAAVGAALFTIAPTVWEMSLMARSYALNALLVGSEVFCLLTWRHTGNARWFYASACIVGLSMMHHGTTYLLLPAYALYFLWVEVERHRQSKKYEVRSMKDRDDARQERSYFLLLTSYFKTVRRRWGFGVLAFLAGLSPFLFLLYRFLFGAPYYWGAPRTLDDFFNLMRGGPFHDQIMGFGADLNSQVGRFLFGLDQLSGQYTWLGIAAGLLGLTVLWASPRRRAEAALITLMIAANYFFAMNYALVGYLYFIPTYLLWGVLMAVGAAWLVRLLVVTFHNRVELSAIQLGLGMAGVVLIGSIAYLCAYRYPNIDQSFQTATRDRAIALMQEAPHRASVYLDWDDISVMRYFRMVYGMRLDMTLSTASSTERAKSIYCDLQNGAAVYVGTFNGLKPENIERDFVLEEAPMGWRVLAVENPTRYQFPPCGACATCR